MLAIVTMLWIISAENNLYYTKLYGLMVTISRKSISSIGKPAKDNGHSGPGVQNNNNNNKKSRLSWAPLVCGISDKF